MYDIILLAAGKEKRFDKGQKVLVETAGMPLICHPLETFMKHDRCRNIVIVTREEYLDKINAICKEMNYSKVKKVVLGGEKRPESVQNGLALFDDKDTLVAIHSVTYPFVSEKELNNLYFTAREEDAAVLGHPIEESVKVTNATMHVTKIETRENRWISHSPTMTSLAKWKELYKTSDLTQEPTDEAALLTRMGHKVQIVPDFRSNIPIYTTYDWQLLCKERLNY